MPTFFGNSLEIMANPEVMKAEKPRASTHRQAKEMMIKGVPGGHLSRVLIN